MGFYREKEPVRSKLPDNHGYQHTKDSHLQKPFELLSKGRGSSRLEKARKQANWADKMLLKGAHQTTEGYHETLKKGVAIRKAAQTIIDNTGEKEARQRSLKRWQQAPYPKRKS